MRVEEHILAGRIPRRSVEVAEYNEEKKLKPSRNHPVHVNTFQKYLSYVLSTLKEVL